MTPSRTETSVQNRDRMLFFFLLLIPALAIAANAFALSPVTSGQLIRFSPSPMVHNTAQRHVINPQLLWNSFLGASGGYDMGFGIAVDNAGNVYVTGSGDASWDTPIRAFSSGNDAFAAKFDRNGVLLWHTFLGGDNEDYGGRITVDGGGNVYVLGHSASSWGNPTRNHSGDSDIFTAKLNNQGQLLWNTFLGSTGYDGGAGIAVDGNGDVFVSGLCTGDWGSPLHAYSGSDEAVVAKLNTSGQLQWHTFVGGTNSDMPADMKIDGNGKILIMGQSWATWGTPINPHTGTLDVFVAKLSGSGSVEWNTFIGGNHWDVAASIALDDNGEIYVTGSSWDTWGTPVRPFSGATDGFAAKFSGSGVLQWHTFLGAASDDAGNGIGVDADGTVYVAGGSALSWGTPINPAIGSYSIYMAAFDNSGALQWNTFLGGDGMHTAFDLSLDGEGNPYLTGLSSNSWGSPNRPHSGYMDAFVLKFCSPLSPTISVSPSPTVDPGGEPNTVYLGYGPQSVTLTASGGSSYSWSPSTYLSCTDCAAPVITPTVPGTYIYTVTATSQYGCTGVAQVVLDVVDLRSPANPNMITLCRNGNTLSVNFNAVPALLQHAGATLGACPQPKETLSGNTILSSYALHQNYPNPFNPGTRISFDLPVETQVLLRVLDMHGRELRTLVNERKQAGSHDVEFDGEELPSGSYIYQLEAGGNIIVRRMMLMK